ncbi:App1 family protein [uncultured Friedmanniella sp.]|uniref:App1 family protein n=1 Tax=uncultured Friedmanniella sp. TaxID=335381 RepID=UPI0035CA4AE5
MTTETADAQQEGSMPESSMHRAARIDLAVLRWRAKRARRAGCHATVIPYTGYGSTTWIRLLGRVLLTRGDQQPDVEPTGARGWRSFTSVPVEDAQVTVLVEGRSYEVRADHSGIVDTVLAVELGPGWHEISLSSEGSEPVTSEVFVVDPTTRVGLVSDIDDTVMVTALPRPLLAAWHTFVVNEHARSTTPGMPVLYERLTSHFSGVPVVYLSTGAWNVAPTLTRFLSRNLYPPGPLLLTDWGPTADRWFRSGQEHKRGNLERLAEEFPDVRWLLVGDDGQHDPMIYGEFLNRHPDQVLAVCIRQLTPGEAVLAGGSTRVRPVDEASDVPWLYAADGAGLAEELDRVGLLPDGPSQPEIDSRDSPSGRL